MHRNSAILCYNFKKFVTIFTVHCCWLKGYMACFYFTHNRQSYDVNMNLTVEGTGTHSSNTLDLKNPYFRYTGQPQTPPGHNTTSPSETYWQQLDAQGARQGQSSFLFCEDQNRHCHLLNSAMRKLHDGMGSFLLATNFCLLALKSNSCLFTIL